MHLEHEPCRTLILCQTLELLQTQVTLDICQKYAVLQAIIMSLLNILSPLSYCLHLTVYLFHAAAILWHSNFVELAGREYRKML